MEDLPVNPFAEPRVEVEKEEDYEDLLRVGKVVSEKTEKEHVLEEIGRILREHNGEESNIGIHHPYWDLVKRYRAL